MKWFSIWDEDLNEYIDYVGLGTSFNGSCPSRCRDIVTKQPARVLALGQQPRRSAIGRKVVENVPGVQSLRLVNSGTEAFMSAIRLLVDYGQRTVLSYQSCCLGCDGLLVAQVQVS